MFQASVFGTKRRMSTESNEPCEKKTKARQITLEDICNPLKAQDKSELTINKHLYSINSFLLSNVKKKNCHCVF